MTGPDESASVSLPSAPPFVARRRRSRRAAAARTTTRTARSPRAPPAPPKDAAAPAAAGRVRRRPRRRRHGLRLGHRQDRLRGRRPGRREVQDVGRRVLREVAPGRRGEGRHRRRRGQGPRERLRLREVGDHRDVSRRPRRRPSSTRRAARTTRTSSASSRAELEILNSDDTLHNIHSLAEKNEAFNLGMPVQGMKYTKKFDKPEVMVQIKCDVHGWMSAYCGVVAAPVLRRHRRGRHVRDQEPARRDVHDRGVAREARHADAAGHGRRDGDEARRLHVQGRCVRRGSRGETRMNADGRERSRRRACRRGLPAPDRGRPRHVDRVRPRRPGLAALLRQAHAADGRRHPLRARPPARRGGRLHVRRPADRRFFFFGEGREDGQASSAAAAFARDPAAGAPRRADGPLPPPARRLVRARGPRRDRLRPHGRRRADVLEDLDVGFDRRESSDFFEG